jgi:hypothetical protein
VSAHDVIRESLQRAVSVCDPLKRTWAEQVLDALKANGYAVVKVPVRNVSDADCSGSCCGGE